MPAWPANLVMQSESGDRREGDIGSCPEKVHTAGLVRAGDGKSGVDRRTPAGPGFLIYDL